MAWSTAPCSPTSSAEGCTGRREQMQVTESLPFLDEHREQVGVPADVAWNALVGVLRRRMGVARSLARVLGCDPVEGTPGFSGRVGETLSGFRVVDSEPGRRLALRGRHRF